jgi:hypothetical protein
LRYIVGKEMAEELPNVPDAAAVASPAPQTAIVVSDAPAVVPSKSVPAVCEPSKLKKIAWRATATIYWIWWIVRFLLGSEFMNQLASTVMAQFGAFLSDVGFAPSHSEYLPRILQFGWLFAVVGFKPFELLGLMIYIYVAPVTFFCYLIFRKYAKDFDATPAGKKGLRPQRVRFPALTIVGLLLLGWFVLYGGANARRPLMAGVILSGLLFFVLAGRAFQRVTPQPILVVLNGPVLTKGLALHFLPRRPKQ